MSDTNRIRELDLFLRGSSNGQIDRAGKVVGHIRLDMATGELSFSCADDKPPQPPAPPQPAGDAGEYIGTELDKCARYGKHSVDEAYERGDALSFLDEAEAREAARFDQLAARRADREEIGALKREVERLRVPARNFRELQELIAVSFELRNRMPKEPPEGHELTKRFRALLHLDPDGTP